MVSQTNMAVTMRLKNKQKNLTNNFELTHLLIII
jgi:hypothetical protein